MTVEIGRVRSAVIATAGVAAVFGLYWDDAWHTDVGRDTFFSPPHLLLYAGVAVLLATIASWAWARYQAEGRALLRDPRVALPLFGAGVTLLAAPVDEAWHQLFGRDAVVWSPPHMVIVAGLVAFAAGVLLAVQRGTRWSSAAGPVVGAFLIAAVGATVMEYEADVPQFAVVWYLPVAVSALTFAFGLIHRISAVPWAATRAAGVYVLLRVAVVGFLAVLGHSLPTVMPTVVAAWAFDLAMRRGLRRGSIAAVTTAATVGSYVAAHLLQPAGLAFSVGEAAAGLVLGLPASWAILAAVGTGRDSRANRRVPVGAAVAAVLAVMMVAVPTGPAFAHDPGQGDEVAPVVLEARRNGDRIVVEVTAAADSCAGWEPVRLVARRAGRTSIGPLTPEARCRYSGTVEVDDPGRWFVYAELEAGGRLVEAWLPVEDGPHGKDTVLYVASGGELHLSQVLAGVLVYAVAAAILGAVVVACRRAPSWSGDHSRLPDAHPPERAAVGAG